MQAYTKPLSLWQLVTHHVQSHEQEEIKTILGMSLVEQSLELHQEIDMLLQIWREMRDDQNITTLLPSNPLPEPPHQRDRLVQEICFFLDHVKIKAKEKGIDPEHILKRHNSDILDYATESTRSGSSIGRMSRLTDGRETPMMPLSPDRIELAHKVTGEVEAANECLNFLDFDEVCLNLRSVLEKEIEQLMEDIQFLRDCLDDEATVHDCATPQLISREPTLAELREGRSKLEKELLATNSLKMTPVVAKPTFSSKTMPIPKTSGLLDVVHSSSTRPIPVKVNHNITSPFRVGCDISGQSTLASAQTSPSTTVSSKTLLTSKFGAYGRTNNICSSRNSSPVRSSTSEIDSNIQHRLHYRNPLHGLDPQLTNKHFKLSASSAATAASSDAHIVRHRRTRATNQSLGRVKVIDLAQIVDVDAAKGDSRPPTFSPSASSFTSSTSFTPMPPTPTSDKDTTSLQPGSAHADRFRKMVMECRGEK